MSRAMILPATAATVLIAAGCWQTSELYGAALGLLTDKSLREAGALSFAVAEFVENGGRLPSDIEELREQPKERGARWHVTWETPQARAADLAFRLLDVASKFRKEERRWPGNLAQLNRFCEERKLAHRLDWSCYERLSVSGARDVILVDVEPSVATGPRAGAPRWRWKFVGQYGPSVALRAKIVLSATALER